MLRKFCFILNLYRTAPMYLLLKKEFEIDSYIWSNGAGAQGLKNYKLFCFLMIYYKEYRNVLSCRITNPLKRIAFDILFPKVESIMIMTAGSKIGKGLNLGHRTSIIICAEKIGDNCCIYQQTTIGNGKTGMPTIGNNVMVYAGAKIFGGITIGDNVTVGANAVVTKDVPQNAIVAGVPAKIIGYNEPT